MSFNFTFGDISNQSILTFDPRCLIVATPEGTPSPPEVTSTVARPLMNLRKVSAFREKLKNVKIDVDDDNDTSYVQPSSKKTIRFQKRPEEDKEPVSFSKIGFFKNFL